MNLSGGIFRPGMRAYFVPLAAGLVLTGSAFLPWVIVDGQSMAGVPEVWALWVVGVVFLVVCKSLQSNPGLASPNDP